MNGGNQFQIVSFKGFLSKQKLAQRFLQFGVVCYITAVGLFTNTSAKLRKILYQRTIDLKV